MKSKMKYMYTLMLLFVYAVFSIGCVSTAQEYQYSWEIYEVERSAYYEERVKLVDSLENTLLKHRFYPEIHDDLSKPGESTMMTDWNDENAKNTISSYEGYRLRVHAIVTDDLSQFEQKPDDPVMARYLESEKERKGNDKIQIGLAIAVEKEINTAMPRYLGDVKTARWEYEGEDLEYAKRLHYEILKSFNLVARDPINTNDYLSDKMKAILGSETGTEKKDDTEDGKPKDDFRILD